MELLSGMGALGALTITRGVSRTALFRCSTQTGRCAQRYISSQEFKSLKKNMKKLFVVALLGLSINTYSQSNPLGDGYYQNTNPLGDGYVQDTNPLGDGYVQDSNPLGDGYVQDTNPLGDGYIQDSNPLGDGYVQDKSVFGTEDDDDY